LPPARRPQIGRAPYQSVSQARRSASRSCAEKSTSATGDDRDNATTRVSSRWLGIGWTKQLRDEERVDPRSLRKGMRSWRPAVMRSCSRQPHAAFAPQRRPGTHSRSPPLFGPSIYMNAALWKNLTRIVHSACDAPSLKGFVKKTRSSNWRQSSPRRFSRALLKHTSPEGWACSPASRIPTGP
jgi:hypothetical protein